MGEICLNAVDCISINFLVVILYHHNAGCYHWGKWIEYKEFLYYYSKLHGNVQLYLKKKI